MTVIKVPDIPGPREQLCWAQCNPKAPPFTHAMERCDRAKGHTGPHTWEFVRQLEADQESQEKP